VPSGGSGSPWHYREIQQTQQANAAPAYGPAGIPVIMPAPNTQDFPPVPPVSAAPLIEIADLAKVYRGAPRPALDGLSLSVRPGAFFGLLGPNGAGKSTLISILCGLLAPTRGTVRVLGADVRAEPERVKAAIGLVPQDLALYPTLTARENLEFFGRMQGLSGARLRERVTACLAIARLEALAGRRTETFSGGLKRRLNLAIGLIHEPRLLILDEPTVGIDPQSRHFIHESLRALHAAGLTLVYTTHYMDEAEQLCDDIAIIDHGRILARGTLPELLRTHRDGAIEVHLESDLPAALVEALPGLPHVRACRCAARSFLLESDAPPVTLDALLAALKRAHLAPTALSMGALNLEQLFLALTGTPLRD
jgi:ABC-2 type transport system ATP-binding protein